jgi:uncharacterized metal-binding protein YceD (DUF177 family)
MSGPTPEFSRLVLLARLGLQPLSTTIEATAEERERLARRFNLVALDRLAATVVLQRLSGKLVRLDASFEAEFTQECVVTLDPAPGRVAQTFSLLYGPLEGEQAEAEIDAEANEPVFEPLTGDAIDIGEAVAQELSLALPEFPRLPEAEIDLAEIDPAEIAGSEDGLFAALARLRRTFQS